MEEILVNHGLAVDEAWKRLELYNANTLEGVKA
jgi:hypothetical protein